MTHNTLNQYPVVPLTDQQSQLFMGLLVAEMMTDDISDAEVEAAVAGDFVSQVITKRLEGFDTGGKFNPYLTLWISQLAEGNPGRGLMLARACHLATPEGELSTLATFANTFPTGVPSDETYDQAWNDQKVDGTSSVDVKEGWMRK